LIKRDNLLESHGALLEKHTLGFSGLLLGSVCSSVEHFFGWVFAEYTSSCNVFCLGWEFGHEYIHATFDGKMV